MIQGLIFDKDGTLFDFRRSWARWVHHLLDDLASNEAHRRMLAEALGFERALDSIRAAAATLAEEGRRVAVLGFCWGGTLALLEALKARNHWLAVATGKQRRGLARMFAETGLEKYFDTSRCADEAQSKPHPDMLQQILQELDVNAAEAIMVGDTSHDMKMAQAIAMPRVGVTHGVHGRDVLSQFAPKAIIDTMPELLQVI